MAVVVMLGESGSLDRERCRAFVAFLRRLTAAEGAPEDHAPSRAQVAAALEVLSDASLLSHAGHARIDVSYVPSRAAKADLLDASANDRWPEAIHRRHLDAIRRVPGAIFAFPVEGEETIVEVFITDWSPCPAAAAIAVHPRHPLARTVDARAAPFFTGRFVRHPLTGDLLPVWCADWVKPEIGTGAVLVNPAHDHTDLVFAQAIGLPIRFALVPEGAADAPQPRPTPPIVRTGRTIRTGRFDGLTAEQAADAYFRVLAEAGLAARWVDLQAGRATIATLERRREGDAAWCETCGRVAPHDGGETGRCGRCGGPADLVSIDPSEALEAAIAAGGSPAVTLVCSAAAQQTGALFVRLLHRDLYGRRLEPRAVHLVQRVQVTQDSIDAGVASAVALVGAPANQVVALRRQIADQVVRFLHAHADLLARAAGRERPDLRAGASGKAAAQVRAAIRDQNPAQAFALLRALQKQVRDAPEGGDALAAIDAYWCLAHVLLGVDTPAGVDARAVWTGMQPSATDRGAGSAAASRSPRAASSSF